MVVGGWFNFSSLNDDNNGGKDGGEGYWLELETVVLECKKVFYWDWASLTVDWWWIS